MDRRWNYSKCLGKVHHFILSFSQTFRILTALFFGGSYFVALCTFLNTAGFSSEYPIVLYVMYFIYNGSAILLYVMLQLFLVFNTLHDRWPIGDIFLGLLFLGLSICATFGFSNQICRFAVHYIDGMFIGSSFLLLSVMMVYKYWDSITTEDLEFSVGGNTQIWHLQHSQDGSLDRIKTRKRD